MSELDDLKPLDDGLNEKPECELSNDELIELVDQVIELYRGDVTELANAIGVFMLGRKIGWRPTYVLHRIKTIKRYEEILSLSGRDIKFQKYLPEGGPKRHRLVAWRVAYRISNFWKLVKGEVANVRTADWRLVK